MEMVSRIDGPPDFEERIALAINNAVAAERERCARECELVSQNWSANNDEYKSVALMCAEQIRTGRH